jgi:hypothetical protein
MCVRVCKDRRLSMNKLHLAQGSEKVESKQNKYGGQNTLFSITESTVIWTCFVLQGFRYWILGPQCGNVTGGGICNR